MRRRDYVLILLIIILLPIAVISFSKKETNFFIPQEIEKKEIMVSLDNTKMSLNDYVIGVVSAEMPALFNEEALKAQAVAARTYTLSKYKGEDILMRLSEQAFMDDEDLKEKWGSDYDKYHNKIAQIVKDTDMEVITYDGKLIHAYYYAMSNGYTEDALTVFKEEEPYLNVISSPGDQEQQNFLVSKTLSYQEFLEKLGLPEGELVVDNILRNDSQRIEKITINNKEFAGTEVRKLLDLRSTDFEIVKDNDNVVITTKGYGHGVGMSQYGANYLAKEGKNYKEILTYYYQNTKIERYSV